MNCKGTAVVAVAFPNGKTGMVLISEYPQCITLFCRVHDRRLPNGILDAPEIDVEAFKMEQERVYLIRGKGCENYILQVKEALEGYFASKNRLFKVVD